MSPGRVGGGSSVAERTDNTELTKTYFEFFKHFSTLSAAAAGAAVTISGLVEMNNRLLALSLLLFGLTLITSITEMVTITEVLRLGVNMRLHARRGGVIVSAFFFTSGVAVFVAGAEILPEWMWVLIGFISLVAVFRVLSRAL